MKTTVSFALAFAALAEAAPQAATLSAATGPIPPVRSSQVSGATSHGSYSGSPTTTGALSKTPLAMSIGDQGPMQVTYTNNNGELQATAMPVPYQPAGGQGVNGTEPYYRMNHVCCCLAESHRPCRSAE